MKITILGNQGPFPGAGGTCSGYLIETENCKILLDCGSGTLSNLQHLINISELDAIILSHLHDDHITDMSVLKFCIKLSKTRPGETPSEPIPVYCPKSPIEELDKIDKEAFVINNIDSESKINIKDIDITFCLVEHPYECYAICLTNSNKKFVYSGDTGYIQELIDFSKNADLLIGDAGFTDKHKVSDNLVHMTARQNGIIAKKAGVKKLVLSHFWPYDDTNIHLKEAQEEFDNVETSEIFKSYYV